MIDFAGQVVVVTGAGRGRGLGRLYALETARRGACVVVNDLGTAVDGTGSDTTVADEVVEQIRDAGGSAVACYDDVADPGRGEAIVGTALDRFSRVDAVVSNAGIFHPVPFEELTVEHWRRTIEVNLDGTFHLAQAAFKVMKPQRYGRFVFIASSAGTFGQPAAAHYAASKSAVVGLMNTIALEGAEHGIVANCLQPFGSTRLLTETVGDRPQSRQETAFAHAIRPELVVPIAVYLASRRCTTTHQNDSAAAGRYARVFTAVTRGWLVEPGDDPSAEQISAHLPEISAVDKFSIPTSIYDEISDLFTRLGIKP